MYWIFSKADKDSNTDRLLAMKETLTFKNEVDDFKKQIDSLPDGYTSLMLLYNDVILLSF